MGLVKKVFLAKYTLFLSVIHFHSLLNTGQYWYVTQTKLKIFPECGVRSHVISLGDLRKLFPQVDQPHDHMIYYLRCWCFTVKYSPLPPTALKKKHKRNKYALRVLNHLGSQGWNKISSHTNFCNFLYLPCFLLVFYWF